MKIIKKLALEIKMLFEVSCLRRLDEEIKNNYLDECSLETAGIDDYYILVRLKKALPKYVKIPPEYRSLRVETRIVGRIVAQ